MRLAAILVTLALAACGSRQEGVAFTRSSYTQLTDWAQEDHAQALAVFRSSCPVLARKPLPATAMSKIAISGSVWNGLCAQADAAGDAKQFFEANFTPFAVSDGKQETGLFTGYYEPSLNGARRPAGPYTEPVYAAPADLKTRNPYFTRAQIEAGALKGRGLELVWVDDPVMLFFLQIQGSGRVRLPDGSEMRLGYAGKNGQPYISLGKVMEQQGLLEPGKVDFFSIRDWLRNNPKQARKVMDENPSYVFFKELAGQADNPPGAVGVPLTPLRSLAVDKRIIPYGLPLFLQTQLPDTPGWPGGRFNRILIAQDTGGAIKGAVRGDIFFGNGEQAEQWAGLMKGRGTYFLLVPNAAASQLD